MIEDKRYNIPPLEAGTRSSAVHPLEGKPVKSPTMAKFRPSYLWCVACSRAFKRNDECTCPRCQRAP